MIKEGKLSAELVNAIAVVKTTGFYKDKVEALYVCDEEPDTIFFKPKAPYYASSIRGVFNELKKHGLAFYVQDILCACVETDESTVYYELKEV